MPRLSARARTLMYLAERRIDFKQSRIIRVGVDELQQSLKQIEPTPKAEFLINAVPINRANALRF